MYANSLVVRVSILVFVMNCAVPASGQTPSPLQDPHAQHKQQPAPPDPHAEHKQPDPHAQHAMGGSMLFDTRDASGTAWLPEQTPMYGVFQTAGAWQLMWHGNGFLQYLRESGDRGRDRLAASTG